MIRKDDKLLNPCPDAVRLTVLGTRGSIPVSGSIFRRFGGATSCYLLEAGGQRLYLDGGTGLVNAPKDEGVEDIHILLTHLHIDHILGIPFFWGLSQGGRRVRIYAEPRQGMSAEKQLRSFLKLPLWPVYLDAYPADAACEDLVLPTKIGAFCIDGMESCHPGGSTIFRVSVGGKSLVYATDFEHFDKSLEALIAFSAGADLLLYDGQYMSGEYPSKKGFGHSVPDIGVRVFQSCGAKQVLFVHHDPGRSDVDLEKEEKRLRAEYGIPEESLRFAREGDTLVL